MNYFLTHRYTRIFLVFVTLFLMWRVYEARRAWYHGKDSFIVRPEPRNRDDDAAYYFIGEHFWHVPHDGIFVAIPSAHYAALMEAYPIRGVGLGALVVPLQRKFGANWRRVYIRLITAINMAGILVLAFGMAAYAGTFLLVPVFFFLIDKFHLYITDPTAYCTEAVSRGLVPAFLGIGLVLANKELSRRMFYFLSTLFILINIYLVQMKVQWLLGMGMMMPFLFLSKETRKAGYVFLAATVISALSIRALNYVRYNGNKELFASNGYMALRWDMEGPEIMRIGCEEKRFPASLAEHLCGSDIRTITYTLTETGAPPADQAKFLEICSKINMEIFWRNVPARIHRLIENNIPVLQQMYFTLEVPRLKKKIVLGVMAVLFVGSLFVLPLKSTVQILGICAFLFGALLVPNMTASRNQWEYRYGVPVRVFFYLTPMMAIIAAFWQEREKIFRQLLRFRSK
jgi:hypothetical protein